MAHMQLTISAKLTQVSLKSHRESALSVGPHFVWWLPTLSLSLYSVAQASDLAPFSSLTISLSLSLSSWVSLHFIVDCKSNGASFSLLSQKFDLQLLTSLSASLSWIHSLNYCNRFVEVIWFINSKFGCVDYKFLKIWLPLEKFV